MKKFIVICVALVGAIFIYLLSTWDAAQESIPPAPVPQNSPQLERKRELEQGLQETDEAISHFNKKREQTNSNLEAARKMKNEKEEEILSKLTTFPQEKRARLQKEFEAQKLSEENIKTPEIEDLYIQYDYVIKIDKRIRELQEEKTGYDNQIKRLQKERTKYQELIYALEQLGLDLENGRTFGDEDSEAFSHAIAQNEDKKMKLNPNDVLQNVTPESKAITRQLFSEADQKVQEQKTTQRERQKESKVSAVKEVKSVSSVRSKETFQETSKEMSKVESEPLQTTNNATVYVVPDKAVVSNQIQDEYIEYRVIQRVPIFPRVREWIDSRRNRRFH